MTNLKCPRCGSQEVVCPTPSGPDDNVEFENDDNADCCGCMLAGLVYDFTQPDQLKRDKFHGFILRRTEVRKKIELAHAELDELLGRKEAVLSEDLLRLSRHQRLLAGVAVDLGFLCHQERVLSRKITDGIA